MNRRLLAKPIAIAALDLRGRVTNAETGAQFIADIVEKEIVLRRLFHHEMNGERHFSRAHRPDVEIVDCGHAR